MFLVTNLYLNNDVYVQSIINQSLYDLREQLKITAEVELNKITKEDTHHQLITGLLQETSSRCDNELITLNNKIVQQVNLNATMFNNQYEKNNEIIHYQIDKCQKDCQTEIALFGRLIDEKNKQIKDIENKLDDYNSYYRCGFFIMGAAIVGLGIKILSIQPIINNLPKIKII